jgi:formyl-CoA transferase
MGNQHPSIAPYELLQCRDGYLAVACGNDEQFRRLCAALGVPTLAAEPRYATNGDRVHHREELVADLETRLLEADSAEWEQALRNAGIAAGQVGDMESAFERAEKLGLEPTRQVGPGHAAQVANPVRYSGFQPAPPVAPPLLGEHDQVVRAWLSDPASTLPDLDPSPTSTRPGG